MADNRKYYYLKLKENFFDSDSIVLLEDMKDGILYGIVGLAVGNGGFYVKTDQPTTNYRPLPKTIP